MARRSTGRWAARVAYDSPVPQTMLAVWYVFAVSALTLLVAAPYIAFELLVGWQRAPLALLLGALACTVAGPALRGLLGATAELVDRRYYPGAPLRRFVRSIAGASRGLRMLWAGLPAVALLLALDAALYGTTPGVLPAVAVLGVLVLLTLLGATVLDLSQEAQEAGSALRLLTAAVRALARRWYVHLAWLLLAALTVALAQVPVVGPVLLLLLPGGWAAAVLVVDRAFPARAPR